MRTLTRNNPPFICIAFRPRANSRRRQMRVITRRADALSAFV